MKKIIVAFLILFIVIVIQQYFFYKNNAKNYLLPANYQSDYFNKYANIYCTQPAVYNLPPEAVSAFNFIVKNIGFSNPVQNCLVFKYDFIKSEDRNLNSFFKFDEKESTPNNAFVVIDNVYKSTSEQVTALLLLHEMSNAFEYFKAEQTKIILSCQATELLAYKTQTEFFDKLSPKDRLFVYLDIFSKSINDSRYEIIRQVLSINIKANIFCFYNQSCIDKNTTKFIEKIIKEDSLLQKYCPGDVKSL